MPDVIKTLTDGMEEYKVNIVNLRNKEKYDFRCDRESPVGNPYYMKNEWYRKSVCHAYNNYFHSIMTRPEEILSDEQITFRNYAESILEHLKQYKEVVLACWCTPLRCHCETIKEWLLTQVAKDGDCNMNDFDKL